MSDPRPHTHRSEEKKDERGGEGEERMGAGTGVFSTHLRCPGSVLGLLVMKLLRGRGGTLGRG